MLMTVEEAGKVWCPFSRAVQIDSRPGGMTPIAGAPVGINRMAAQPVPVDPVPAGCHCLGPRCALWDWANELRIEGGCGMARHHPIHQISVAARGGESIKA